MKGLADGLNQLGDLGEVQRARGLAWMPLSALWLFASTAFLGRRLMPRRFAEVARGRPEGGVILVVCREIDLALHRFIGGNPAGVCEGCACGCLGGLVQTFGPCPMKLTTIRASWTVSPLQ